MSAKENIEINRLKFLKFLGLICLKSSIENQEAIITVNEDNITVRVVSPDKTVALSGKMKGEFLDWGDLGIDNLNLLKKLVETLSTELIIITKSSNKLIVTNASQKTRISSLLRDPQYILNQIAPEKFEGVKAKSIGNEFILSRDVANEITNYVSTLNSSNLILKGEDKKLILEVENDDNKIVSEFDINESVTKFAIKLKSIFVDLLSVLNEDVTISVKDGSPVYVKLSDDSFNFEFIIAPIKMD